MAARISLRVKSGCLATRAKSHSECSSSGEVLPPLGLASTLPVSLRRRHHRITELTPTSNTSATSRRDAPLSTASTARSRKSVEYGFGIDLAPRRINFSRFARAKAVGNPPDSMPPGNALARAQSRVSSRKCHRHIRPRRHLETGGCWSTRWVRGAKSRCGSPGGEGGH